MKLSIIIPVYRVEATLERCLESVVGQSFGDFEVIVVDDGSPDICPQLCDEWAMKDSRIHVIHKANGGLSDARNAGLDVAQGEWVTFVDSDDFLSTDTYREVMPLTADADIVEFPLIRFYGSPSQQLVSFKPAVCHDMQDYWLRQHAYEHCYAWNKIYRRSLFDEVRFPVGRVFEDVATLPQLLARAKSVRLTDCGCYYYCANSRGITSTATGRELQMLLNAHLKVMDKWCDSRYYMHVLNIQLDVSRLLGISPALPCRRVSPLTKGLTPAQRIKALMTDIIGIKGLCKLNKMIHGRS